MPRTSSVQRNTKETKISLDLNLDGSGIARLHTGIGFFDHMLDGFARHGLFDLTVKVDGGNDPILVGQIELYRFPNAVGLEAVGSNLFKVTNASGMAIAGRPGYDGMGVTKHKFLEMSNVSVVNEMVQMIVAQRAYEFSSKAIQTSDTMLSSAVNLKR